MPFPASNVVGASVHTENIWSRLRTAIWGKKEDPKPAVVAATDGYEPVNKVADPQNPQAMIAAGAAAGGQVKLAVANKHQALAKVIEHLTVHPGGFGVMSRYLRGMTPAELESSVFMKYFHDLDNQFIIFLQDPPGISLKLVNSTLLLTVSCTLVS